LLSNARLLPDVIETTERALVVGKAIETFHESLHGKLKILNLNLWPYVRRDGHS
jgi:hypothetical protein